jgi:hypothetical protein
MIIEIIIFYVSLVQCAVEEEEEGQILLFCMEHIEYMPGPS